MFDENHYVPILKWRMGEYQALLHLKRTVKDWCTPLLEIPTEAWDFEEEKPAKSLDDHLSSFGKRLKAKWDTAICFVDSPYIDGAAKVASGQHHLEFIFDQARAAKCKAIPVVGLRRASAYVSAVRRIAAADSLGICLRLEPEDFTPSLQADIDALLSRLAINVDDVDLVIDSKDSIQPSATTQAAVWKAQLMQIPYQVTWNTLTIAGTAFPAALPASVYRPKGTAKRNEWLAYKHLISTLKPTQRIPTFGDYATSHPVTALLDPRVLDPNAKIKYTIDDAWFIVVGTQVKLNGRGQYVQLCERIINERPAVFSGASYSWGDKYIADCAAKAVGTGGTSTWPTVATNHHVTRAIRDVAKFHGSLPSP